MSISPYLGSVIIVVVAAAMAPSAHIQWREVADPASLVVLTHSGAGVGSSSEDYRAAQVDSAGITTKRMLMIINTSHVS